jgi:Right handed beta helix region
VSQRTRRTILVAALAVTALMAIPALASAAGVYVSSSATVVPGGKSCTQPGFSSVQAAIGSGAKSVNVCPGTFEEQLTITKGVKLTAINGAGTVLLKMPAAASNSATPCDTMVSAEQKDEISICTPETVSISNLNVEAIIPTTSCLGQLNGIFVAGGGTLKATNMAINGASTTVPSLKGCQYGIAVEVGNKSPAEVGHATLKKVTVTGYQKNGPTVKSTGSTLSISSSTITGEGESPYIGQNGIEVAYGAKGTIKSSVISGNECSIPGVCSAEDLENHGSGVLFYQAAAGSGIASSTIKENDDGAYYSSGSATVPSSADVTFSKDVFTNNRYEAFQIEEGKSALTSDTINGSGLVGINLVQASYQESASQSSATHTTIAGQSEASIKVTSDKEPGDIPGKFVFSKGTAAAPVLLNESSNFVVEF